MQVVCAHGVYSDLHNCAASFVTNCNRAMAKPIKVFNLSPCNVNISVLSKLTLIEQRYTLVWDQRC